jgi:hypothetical protein
MYLDVIWYGDMCMERLFWKEVRRKSTGGAGKAMIKVTVYFQRK